jgi:hypothetical protein
MTDIYGDDDDEEEEEEEEADLSLWMRIRTKMMTMMMLEMTPHLKTIKKMTTKRAMHQQPA